MNVEKRQFGEFFAAYSGPRDAAGFRCLMCNWVKIVRLPANREAVLAELTLHIYANHPLQP